jgi:DNA-binding PadR family transcriptional regulator
MKKTSPAQYIPLTHTTYYILISLITPLHGYGIMQKVEEMSHGDVKLGPGTLYGALSKMEKEQIIVKTGEDEERRKCYVLTDLGRQIVKLEWNRLRALVEVSRKMVETMEVENE